MYQTTRLPFPDNGNLHVLNRDLELPGVQHERKIVWLFVCTVLARVEL